MFKNIYKMSLFKKYFFQDEPAFEFDGKNFTLLTVHHDKNQHLYIRTNPVKYIYI